MNNQQVCSLGFQGFSLNIPEVEGPNDKARLQDGTCDNVYDWIITSSSHGRVRMGDDGDMAVPFRKLLGRSQNIWVIDAAVKCGVVVEARERKPQGRLREHRERRLILRWRRQCEAKQGRLKVVCLFSLISYIALALAVEFTKYGVRVLCSKATIRGWVAYADARARFTRVMTTRCRVPGGQRGRY